MRRLRDILVVAWASPWTLVGLLVGLLVGVVCLLGGGGVGRSGRAVEFHGPLIRRLLRRVPIKGGASALTLGHVVLGASPELLEVTRPHERVHVRQYELWGPLMVPAYLACSIVLLVLGRGAYRDNPFERQACDKARSDPPA